MNKSIEYFEIGFASLKHVFFNVFELSVVGTDDGSITTTPAAYHESTHDADTLEVIRRISHLTFTMDEKRLYGAFAGLPGICGDGQRSSRHFVDAGS